MRTHLALVVVVPLALAGCSSHTSRTTTAPTPTTSPTVMTPSAVPSTSSPTPSATVTSPAGTPTCASSALRLTVRQAGAAAGTTYWGLDLQSTATSRCSLRGYPGVSFTDAAGHQLGLPASRSTSFAPTLVVLAPGQYAHAAVGIPDPGNWQTGSDPASSTCHPATTAYVRVYPPDQRVALTAALATSICTTTQGRTSVTSVSAGRAPAG